MGTRANINLIHGDTNIWLYRHYDGYPSETGYNLASLLIHNPSFKKFFNSLISQKYNPNEINNEKPVYEITNGKHGDIDYLYTFIFGDNFAASNQMVKVTIIETEPFESDYVKRLVHTDYFYITREEVRKNLKALFDKDSAKNWDSKDEDNFVSWKLDTNP